MYLYIYMSNGVLLLRCEALGHVPPPGVLGTRGAATPFAFQLRGQRCPKDINQNFNIIGLHDNLTIIKLHFGEYVLWFSLPPCPHSSRVAPSLKKNCYNV